MDAKLEQKICKMSVSEFKRETNIVNLIKNDILKRKPHRFEKEINNIDIYVEQVYKKYMESKQFRSFYNKKLILITSTKNYILNKAMPASVREKLKRKFDSAEILLKTSSESNFENKKQKSEVKNNDHQQSIASLLAILDENPLNSENQWNIMDKTFETNIQEKSSWNKSNTKQFDNSCNNFTSVEQLNSMNSNNPPFAETTNNNKREGYCEISTFFRNFKEVCFKIPLCETSMLGLTIQQILHTFSYKEFIEIAIFPKSLANNSSLLNKLKEYYRNEFYLRNEWPPGLCVKMLKLKKFIQNKLYIQTFNLYDIPPKFFTIEDLKTHTNFIEILEKLDIENSLDINKNVNIQTMCYEWLVENNKWIQNLKFNKEFFIEDLKNIENMSEITNSFNDISLQSLNDSTNSSPVELKCIKFNDFFEYSNIFGIVEGSLKKIYPSEKLTTDFIKKHCQYFYKKIISENSLPKAITFKAKFVFTILPTILDFHNKNKTRGTAYSNETRHDTTKDMPPVQLPEVSFSTTGPIVTREFNNESFNKEENISRTIKTGAHKNSIFEEKKNHKDKHQQEQHTLNDGLSKKLTNIVKPVEQIQDKSSVQIKEEPVYSQYESDVVFVPNTSEDQIVIDDSEVTVTDLLKEIFEFGSSQSSCFNFS